ncbi:unnamed protein product, partial [Mesorhabditis spiculigera]
MRGRPDSIGAARVSMGVLGSQPSEAAAEGADAVRFASLSAACRARVFMSFDGDSPSCSSTCPSGRYGVGQPGPEPVSASMPSQMMGLIDEGEPSFNLRLIEAVKHNRCLFDATDRQYRSTEYKTKVWNRLVTYLAFDGDSRTLYNRWKQLRDKYGKEKKKHKGGTNSTWQYYKHLVFLDPHMSDRPHTKNVIVTKEGRQIIDMNFYVTDPHFNAGLIEEVKRHTCLFDIRDPKYRHTEYRNMAWNSIISALNFPIGDITMIYKQWKKLRDRYVREKKRLRMLPQGQHEDSTWDLYGAMTWMDPYLDERSASGKKRKMDNMDMSDEDIWEDGAYMMLDKRASNGDVLLDGDSAFAASTVSDLRSLSEDARLLAKAQIEALFEPKPSSQQQHISYDLQ